MDPANAAARLRYVAGVQQRTRRAAVAPSVPLIALGLIVLAHGAVATAWPHAALASLVWVAVAIAARPILRVLRRRLADERGLHGLTRWRLATGALGLATAGIAVALGAAPLISAIAVATALPAYLAGMPSIALSAVVVGAIADTVVAENASPAVGELIFGAGLLAIGLVCRAKERDA
jgi:hypothetical protein